ncbi:hypothetical protein GQ55_1G259300 [Panicum hallii var. hallii]|uniref:Uncharacterized protein n=1 Tax=Panicum hallii var. hallii TaxID=1504633 RepID=A0A2T7F7K6_9POAL|nr:hypothetical protein GQ55_1G259300 [Panicum hallii var. hallii]
MAAAAAGAGKGKRKRSLSEDDVYLLLHRYAPGTILTALQEVAQHAEGRRIDWRAVVGKSATGITSAREYQMLWRHFAYNHVLDDTVDAGDQPLGDDSDLELELEPVPNPTKEALSEASALAKALISGSSREQASGQRVNLDAPVLNAPNEKTVRVPSEKQLAQNHRITNITGPVSNSKQASHLGPSPGSLDPNGPSKKKKKPKAWSKEEDADLAAGVQKYGEGNWDYILHKCKFDNTRTPDQLSQRWALICKRPGGSTKPASTKHATVASSEERKDALKALSIAVGPMRRSSMLRPGAQQQGIQHKSTVFAPKIPEGRSAAAPSPAPALPVPVPVPVPVPMPLPVKAPVKSPVPQGQQAPVQRAPPKSANASNKTRKKQSPQPSPIIGPSSIQAAAIAAGGRIAPALTAANFLKVAQSAHIRSQVTGSSKPSASTKAPSVVVEPGTQPGSIQHLEPLNTSAPKSGPSVLTTHATEQVHGASEVAVVNPPGPSAGAHPLETNKALSTTPVPVSCDSEEKEDDSTFCVITIDDLFPEDAVQLETVDLEAKPEIADEKAKQLETVDPVDPKAKQPETVDPKAKQPETADPKAKQPETADPKAKQLDTLNPKVEMVDPKDKDMLEFDQFVASQGGAVNTDHLDKSNRSASQAQALVGSQKKQVKLVPTIGKGNPVSAGVPATVKRTKTSIPHLVNPVPAGSPRGIVGTVNANAPNKTLVRKATTLVPAGVQAPLLKKHATNGKGYQVMQPSTGSGVPASSQASVAVNGASKVNPPSSGGQASSVVNIGSRANPPYSGQASAVMNIGSKANPPSSGQASVVVNGANRAANPPSSGKASAALSGAANKANPPAAPKQ